MLLVARMKSSKNGKEKERTEQFDDSGLVSARDGHKLDGRPRHSEARPVIVPFVEPH